MPFIRALFQSQSEVTVRFPGRRFLSEPLPLKPYAEEHWEFAWLAVAAYVHTPAGQQEQRTVRRTAEDTVDPLAELRQCGWDLWANFPDGPLRTIMDQTHLRVEVWEKRSSSTIAVSFGGSIFNNRMDWRSNLRWFLPAHRDAYSDVVQTFAPAFARELSARLIKDGGEYLRNARVVSVGHSLGGGLAQQFAYCLDPKVPVPRVAKVYAFDPSPVTGFLSVDETIRKMNSRGLKIDRIYERGEILAIARSLVSAVWKPSDRDPAIRGVRYNLFRVVNPVAGHSIIRMAVKLAAAAGHPVRDEHS
ncbi:MAG TPA: lipase family protein [Steroidobacteraceae bacterium]